jgi:hypothetical protein
MTDLEFLESELDRITKEWNIIKNLNLDPIEKGDKQLEFNEKSIEINKQIALIKSGMSAQQQYNKNYIIIGTLAIITFIIIKGKKK